MLKARSGNLAIVRNFYKTIFLQISYLKFFKKEMHLCMTHCTFVFIDLTEGKRATFFKLIYSSTKTLSKRLKAGPFLT